MVQYPNAYEIPCKDVTSYVHFKMFILGLTNYIK